MSRVSTNAIRALTGVMKFSMATPIWGIGNGLRTSKKAGHFNPDQLVHPAQSEQGVHGTSMRPIRTIAASAIVLNTHLASQPDLCSPRCPSSFVQQGREDAVFGFIHLDCRTLHAAWILTSFRTSSRCPFECSYLGARCSRHISRQRLRLA